MDGGSGLGEWAVFHRNGAHGLGPDCVFGFLRKNFMGTEMEDVGWRQHLGGGAKAEFQEMA